MKALQAEMARSRLGSSRATATKAPPNKLEEEVQAELAKSSPDKQKMITDAIAGAIASAKSFKMSDGTTIPPAYVKDFLYANVGLSLEKNATSWDGLASALKSPRYLQNMGIVYRQSLQKAPDLREFAAPMKAETAKLCRRPGGD